MASRWRSKRCSIYRNSIDEWEWYTPKEITPEFARKYPKGSSSEIQVVGSSLKEQKGLVRTLKKNSVDFHPKRQMMPPFGSDGKVGTNLVALFSEQIQRCIAKIAFNYLAKVKGTEFVLRQDFDDIRAYIRYGTKPRVKVVGPPLQRTGLAIPVMLVPPRFSPITGSRARRNRRVV